MNETQKWIEQQQHAAQQTLKEMNNKEEAKKKVVREIDETKTQTASMESAIVHANA